MKKLFAIIAMMGVFAFGATQSMMAQADSAAVDSAAVDTTVVDTAAVDTAAAVSEEIAQEPIVEEGGLHKELKTKFIEGDAGFMSLVAIALVLGLAFCIERIIYLSLAEINVKKLLASLEEKLSAGDVEGAKEVCRNTRGPVASICYQGLMRIDEGIENVERSVVAYGSVQSSYLEQGCSWITLFIAMAPSLGFLGTVIGMVMAFDQIQQAGDISPTVVAGGMKVALITTIFGIVVALILQIFYNYILSKIETITSHMEEATISLLDMCMKYNLKK
jgi:biopolymer transport protein ExbB